MAHRYIVQKAEIALVPRRESHVAHTPEQNLALLPDCGKASREFTVVKLSGGQT